MKPTIIGFVILFTIGVGYLLYKPTNKPAEGSQAVSTEGWKTYANTKYGFQFKYPENLTNAAEETGEGPNNDGALIYDKTNKISFVFEIGVHTQPVGQLTKTYIDPYEFVKDYSAGHFEVSKTSFSGLPAVRVTNDDQWKSTGYVVIKDNLVYFIMWPTNLNEGEQMAQTFIFTK